MRRAARFAPLAALLLPSCTLLGLGDGLAQATGCGDCSELNLIETPPDCMSWQCTTPEDPDNGVCVIDLVDQDDDGAPTAVCAIDERAPDCDDQLAASFPGAPERADGRDNDCDERIDEELALTRTELLPEVSSLAGLSLARRGERDLAAFVSDGALSLAVDGEARAFASADPDPASPTALAPAASDTALAYVTASCAAVRVGLVRDAAPDALALGPALVTEAPACEAAIDHLALARQGEDLALVVWVERTADRDACGRAPGAIAVAQLLGRDEDGAFAPLSEAPLVLGPHEGRGAPALLALAPSGFVVALTSGRTLELLRVDVIDATAGSLRASSLSRLDECDESCGPLALAPGVLADDVPALGLAYAAGTCAAPELRARSFRVRIGALERLEDEAFVVARAEPRALALAGRLAAPAWAVAWTDADALHVARVGWPAPLPVFTTEVRAHPALHLAYGDALRALAWDADAARPISLGIETPPASPPPASP